MRPIKKSQLWVVLILLLFLALARCGDVGRSQRAYKSLRELAGQKYDVYVMLIDSEWVHGIDAIGIVQKTKGGIPVYFYYYRDTDAYAWYRFYSYKDIYYKERRKAFP